VTDFDWVHYTSSDGTGWYGTNAVADLWNNWGLQRPNSSSHFLYLLNYGFSTYPGTNAVFVSPSFSMGIGTIYFEACINNGTAGYLAQFEVDVSTNGGASGAASTATTCTAPRSCVRQSRSTCASRPWCVSCAAYFSGLFTNGVNANGKYVSPGVYTGDNVNDTAIVLDNIRISLPPADLALSATNAPTPQSLRTGALFATRPTSATNLATFNAG